MLETIREYGLERLAEAGEEDRSALVMRKSSRMSPKPRTSFAARPRRNGRPVSIATTTICELRSIGCRRHDPDAALDLAGALGWFWFTRGYLAEGDARLRTALGASNANGRSRARALTASGSLAARIGTVEEGRLRLEERSPGGGSSAIGTRPRARSKRSAGSSSTTPATTQRRSQSSRRRVRSGQDLGDRAGETRALVGVCQVLVALDEVERAEALSHELLERGEDD